MNPSATAETSTSTLSGASVNAAEGNDFMNVGRDMVKFEHLNFTVNNHCAVGDGASEVREDARSGPIATTNVFVTLATLLGGIFGLKASETYPVSSGNIAQQSIPDHNARDHSEPRAMVTETQDMMASALLSVVNSTASPLTQASCSERYIRSMLECSQGYPLYEPEPESQYCQEGVRVGDVGLITEDGGFDFLFNVCAPSDINPDELPDEFEMLRSPEILVKAHFQSDTCLFNNEVKRTEEPYIKYTCSGPEGGVLELPLGATRFEAKNKRSFKRLAIRHAENWYRYTVLTRERDAPNGSLYIVTSCIKCTDWGVAVFDRPSNPQDYLRFITNEENQNGQSKYRWKGSGAYIAKVALNRGSTVSNDADDADDPNQCVFLRGYKIMLRKDIWDNITNSQFNGTSYVTVSPYSQSGNKSESSRQGDSSNQDDLSQSSADNNFGSDCGTTRAAQNICSRTDTSARIILYEYSKTSRAHPSDLINAILLCQEPKAKIALTHDDDWCDLLRYHSQILDSDAPAKVGLPYMSNVDEYGCACLKRSDLNPGPDVTCVESSSDAHVTSTLENHLPVDDTQPSLCMETIPEYELPSMGDDLALLRQDYWHPFNATTRSSTHHSQSSHHIIPSTTATVRSDVDRAFVCEQLIQAPSVQGHYSTAAFSGQPTSPQKMDLDSYLAYLDDLISDGTYSPMTEEEDDEVPEIPSRELAGIIFAGPGDKFHFSFDGDEFSHLGDGKGQSDKSNQLHLPFDGNEYSQFDRQAQWSLPIPASGAAATSTATDPSDKYDEFQTQFDNEFHPYSQLGDNQWSLPIPASGAAATSTATDPSDKSDQFHLPFDGNEYSPQHCPWILPIPDSGAAATSTATDPSDKSDQFHLPFDGNEHSQPGDRQDQWSLPIPANRASGPSTTSIATDQSDKFDKFHLQFDGNEYSQPGDSQDLWSFDSFLIAANEAAATSTATDPSDKFDKFHPQFDGNKYSQPSDSQDLWSFDSFLIAANEAATSSATDQSDKNQFHLPLDGNEYSQPGDMFLSTSWNINDPSSQSPFVPSASGPPVIKLEGVEDYLKAVGSPQTQQAAGKRRKREGAYQCPFGKGGCNATFTTPHNLRYHLNAHLGTKPYKCSQCSYACHHPSTLKRHQSHCKKSPTRERDTPVV